MKCKFKEAVCHVTGNQKCAVTGNQKCDPILREVCVNQVPLRMEFDTGAAVSVITQRTYQKIAQQNHIQPLQHLTSS